jgi:hypothetical protein
MALSRSFRAYLINEGAGRKTTRLPFINAVTAHGANAEKCARRTHVAKTYVHCAEEENITTTTASPQKE